MGVTRPLSQNHSLYPVHSFILILIWTTMTMPTTTALNTDTNVSSGCRYETSRPAKTKAASLPCSEIDCGSSRTYSFPSFINSRQQGKNHACACMSSLLPKPEPGSESTGRQMLATSSWTGGWLAVAPQYTQSAALCTTQSEQQTVQGECANQPLQENRVQALERHKNCVAWLQAGISTATVKCSATIYVSYTK